MNAIYPDDFDSHSGHGRHGSRSLHNLLPERAEQAFSRQSDDLIKYKISILGDLYIYMSEKQKIISDVHW